MLLAVWEIFKLTTISLVSRKTCGHGHSVSVVHTSIVNTCTQSPILYNFSLEAIEAQNEESRVLIEIYLFILAQDIRDKLNNLSHFIIFPIKAGYMLCTDHYSPSIYFWSTSIYYVEANPKIF